MQYNTERKKLIIPEYGRHIQRMVDYCKNITDREERNEFAQMIIAVMGNLNPHLRDIPDFQHKLWDQLFIMAEFDLDVDSPFPIPTELEMNSKPRKIPYPGFSGKYRYYGRNLRKMIEVASEWEDDDKKLGLVKAIANQMKKSYLLWNKDTVEDAVIYKELKELSGGKIDIDELEDKCEHNINLASSKDLASTMNEKRVFTKRKRYWKNNKKKK
ncbi:DUF4290 domain-containing protein [Ornithobacterium rhinotracheale]|uniref:DUF4290 domain-containing protein n=1 Tax=Ornithobacterium rhinotracheale (strain ATCC 51463 / DSM 15997 / CCUG 23171 / CIP 104009 / LMG 9086) TaxID=867902 RepID=I4A0U8_ORNRL|nr:DUF4290 domain-containing protein [Ornithobacterium rhinotracheale]AFL97582.1 hypothetical protein Ornrh_1409 [Ornithobacterium rhinotracheale DSM 15997]AIP98900.1 hypothetical protein Q785_02880 [Ornithobacterium rhinotracheale ORT-UMN 88]KGB66854.1 hypothetical protein Q787_02730 [Ornithobacterium rhinotracheale H06-030791]MBN3661865.1 DUF4290 domain-containing protein [Ornithobacterium rhinotracheale]MCK0194973.1 DUF4290 domain-containing protein [Ornithobacterium rhinotracheale]